MKDPKKILRNWFEQQGQRLEFEVQEDGPGHARVYTVQLRLPLDGAFGQAGTGQASFPDPLAVLRTARALTVDGAVADGRCYHRQSLRPGRAVARKTPRPIVLWTRAPS